jgi:hypothetical protein
MPSRDIRPYIDPKVSLAPAAYAAPTNGTGIDTAGSEAALVVLAIGTITSGTYKVQESTDNSTFTDVADSDLIGVTGNPAGIALVASTVVKISYIGSQRYLRVILTAATAANVSAVVNRGKLRYTSGQPV